MGNVRTVVCLVPVRTDSSLFHETLSEDASIYLLRGRVRFLDPRGGRQHTPFSMMVLALGATADQMARYAELVPGFWLTRQGASQCTRPQTDVPTTRTLNGGDEDGSVVAAEGPEVD